MRSNKKFRFLLASAAVLFAMGFGAAFKAGAAQKGGAIQGTALGLTTSNAVVTTFAGTTSTGTTDGTGAAARFNFPYGITTDGTNLYVADSANYTIRKVVISTGAVTTIAGTAGTSGTADGTGTAARFNNPCGITTDGTNLYVADRSNHTIRQIVIGTNVVTTIAGTAGTSGTANGTGGTALFNNPYGITTDGTNLFVTDTYNHTIRQIVIGTNVVTTIAGTAGSAGSTDGTSSALFRFPRDITTDGTNLFVTDTNNHTIRKIVIGTNVVTTIAGTAGSAGSTDGTSSALFNYPYGITTDGTNLFVTDDANSTIRKIVIGTNAVTTIAGTAGSAGSTDGTGAAARFYDPSGITTDGTNLFVADYSNNTIRKISQGLIVTPSAGSNGTISPSSAQAIISGSTTTFTVTPSAGYSASVGGTCGGSLSGTTYTTNAITADCTVSATFPALPNCSYSLSNSTQTFSANGGTGSFKVNQNETSCNNSGWTAASNASWITLTPSSGNWSSTPVTITVSANTTNAQRTGAITVTGQSNTATITITQNALLSFSPSILNYGTLKPGETATQSLTVTNVSGGSLTLSGVNITGANSAEFILSNNCSTLSNNGTCTPSVKFAPNTEGVKTATLTMTANGISFTVALTGTANKNATPMASVVPVDINGNLDLESGFNDWITIGNTGTGTLTVSSIKFYGEDLYEYTATGSSCSLILSQQSCSLQLSSRYTSNQAKTASLVIASNAGKSEIPINMASRQCISGSISISPVSASVSSNSLTGALTVTAPDNCWWIISSNAAWISADTTNWTHGNGTVNYTVSANTGSASRTGQINVGSIPFTVIQNWVGATSIPNDISGHKFKDNINALYSAGITISSPGFYPDNTATKGDIAAFIIRALYGEDFAYTTTPYFSDVPANHPYFKYVQKLKDGNITWAGGAYGIDSGVRRSWAAAFIIRAIYGETFSYPAASYFSDVPMNHVYFKYIQKMKERGFTNVSGEYSPDDIMPRDALAAFITDAFLGMEH